MRKGPHRKRVRPDEGPGTLHELTFSCYHRMPLLAKSRWRGMLSEAVDRALGRDRFCFVAFVYMPKHMHLLVWPTEPYPWASTAGQARSATRAAGFHPHPNVSQHLTPLYPTGRLSPGAQHCRGCGPSASFPLFSPSDPAFP